MRIQSPLVGKRLSLRCLDPSDASHNYLEWLQDPLVNKYLEVRFNPPANVIDLEGFIVSNNKSDDTLLLGIFLLDENRHIGTIKLGPINPYHERANIGLLIGDKNEWGKGYATEAILLFREYAFNTLNLKKLCAGFYSGNEGSRHAFHKAGFIEEGRQVAQWNASGERHDQVWVGCINSCLGTDRSFKHIRQIVLIGGGNALTEIAHEIQKLNFEVSIILAPRHAVELLADGNPLIEHLKRGGFRFDVIEDINTLSSPPGSGADSLVLCLGPAWIFSPAIRSAYGAGMFNINLIPIPTYLGGAHNTWQILNGNKDGGVIFQEITDELDRGPILRRHIYHLPDTVRTPNDFFEYNQRELMDFMRKLLFDMREGVNFPLQNFAFFDASRLYFPRLITRENGWINWNWDATEIERFCNAFDKPYSGAGTYIGGKEVRLSCVVAENNNPTYFHPFTAGLVVRKHMGYAWVAARGGLLKVGRFVDNEGRDVFSGVREGARLITPLDKLQHALAYRPKVTAMGAS